MTQICLCGAFSGGYPHKADCPYPCYWYSDKRIKAWEDAREERQKALNITSGSTGQTQESSLKPPEK